MSPLPGARTGPVDPPLSPRGLPADTRAKLVSLGAETAAHVAQAQDASVAGLIEEWKAEGIDTYSFSAEELAAVTEATGAVSTDWVERIDNDGAISVLETYSELTGN